MTDAHPIDEAIARLEQHTHGATRAAADTVIAALRRIVEERDALYDTLMKERRNTGDLFDVIDTLISAIDEDNSDDGWVDLDDGVQDTLPFDMAEER